LNNFFYPANEAIQRKDHTGLSLLEAKVVGDAAAALVEHLQVEAARLEMVEIFLVFTNITLEKVKNVFFL
jgi:hypothetical protein